jgi:hypothetical protein
LSDFLLGPGILREENETRTARGKVRVVWVDRGERGRYWRREKREIDGVEGEKVEETTCPSPPLPLINTSSPFLFL